MIVDFEGKAELRLLGDGVEESADLPFRWRCGRIVMNGLRK